MSAAYPGAERIETFHGYDLIVFGAGSMRPFVSMVFAAQGRRKAGFAEQRS
jgi:hypothetical protein